MNYKFGSGEPETKRRDNEVLDFLIAVLVTVLGVFAIAAFCL